MSQHERMYAHWGANTLVVFVTALTVAFAVLLHYEGLRLISARSEPPDDQCEGARFCSASTP